MPEPFKRSPMCQSIYTNAWKLPEKPFKWNLIFFLAGGLSLLHSTYWDDSPKLRKRERRRLKGWADPFGCWARSLEPMRGWERRKCRRRCTWNYAGDQNKI